MKEEKKSAVGKTVVLVVLILLYLTGIFAF